MYAIDLILYNWTVHEKSPSITIGPSQGHLQDRPGSTTLCGWLIHSFSSVIKTSPVFQYLGYTFYEWIIHKNQPHFCKIQARPMPGAVEGLGLAPTKVYRLREAREQVWKWVVEFLSKFHVALKLTESRIALQNRWFSSTFYVLLQREWRHH